MNCVFRRTFTSVSFIAPIIAGKMNNLQPRLQTLAQLIPPLTASMHKGECGRVAAIGGCEEYTGAPYFVASTALRLGADIAYVLCEKDAGTVIKGYSPDIIVAPYLRSVDNPDRTLDDVHSKVEQVLDKVHAVSVGSGLGNDANIGQSVERAIRAARERQLPVVLDADALSLVCTSPDIISGYANAVLTPNAPEFARLCNALGIAAGEPIDKTAQLVAARLNGPTLLIKGVRDVITDGQTVFVCDETSGLRRCGGQGDMLSGAVLTFLAWGELYKRGAWKSTARDSISPALVPMHAAYAASMLTRHASFLAYEECARATMSSSVLDQMDISFDNKFEEILKAVKPK
ncbi:hypothetical protein IWW56_003579 [Coemansia sp. RSA 2131]|nr:hypothetical protein IWW56_003579 [Coemansia sp. RSA 2131]